MLKADLHLHTSEDPHDPIAYSARELIDYAKTLGFDVLSVTLHNKLLYEKRLFDYAKKKGILLISGVEMNIEGADVLVYNAKPADIRNIKKISDLKLLRKKKNVLIAAPHPYYIYRSLGKKLVENIHLFDAIEYCHFYIKWMNAPNKKAARVAHKYGKTLIGNSDAHHLWRINTTYTLVDSKKDINSIINSIKKGNVKVVSTHLSLLKYAKALGGTFSSIFKRKVLKQRK
jgi:predicted metal-dependent phosphoesterase TrpH